MVTDEVLWDARLFTKKFLKALLEEKPLWSVVVWQCCVPYECRRCHR